MKDYMELRFGIRICLRFMTERDLKSVIALLTILAMVGVEPTKSKYTYKHVSRSVWC